MLPPYVTHIMYVCLILVSTLVALSLRYAGITIGFGANLGINGFSTCVNTTGDCSDPDDSTWVPSYSISYTLCSGGKCKGYFAVFQVSFALMAFFAVMVLFTGCKMKASAYAHRGHWFLKVVGIVGVVVATAFMPPDVLAYYAWVARFISPFWLLYQLTSFIGFAYNVNEWLCSWDEDHRRFFGCDNESGMKWKYGMAWSSLLGYVGVLSAIGWMYSHFGQGGDCAFNTAVITLTLLFVLLNTTLSMVQKIAPHGAIITSAAVSLYTTYLCFSSLSSWPDAKCNPDAESEGVIVMVVSICFALGGVFLSTIFLKGSTERFEQTTGEVLGKPAASDQVTVSVPEDGDDGVEARSYAVYHAVLFLYAVYMSMLLTNWSMVTKESSSSAEATAEDPEAIVKSLAEGGDRFNVGYASAWVQAGTNWTCNLIYLWTLVAPRLCKNRDFGVDFD